jgi:hypothetical protein
VARLGPAGLVLGNLPRRPELLFGLFYRACADDRGPFQPPPIPPARLTLDGTPAPALTAADNDGVVNTASMAWDGDGVLVEGDHGDVIGHFLLRPTGGDAATGRRFTAYDFFQRGRSLDPTTFTRVWEDILSFAAGR